MRRKESRVPRSALGTPHAYLLYDYQFIYPFSSELGYIQLFVFILCMMVEDQLSMLDLGLIYLLECSPEFSVVSCIRTGYI